jgi:hypothetical protein
MNGDTMEGIPPRLPSLEAAAAYGKNIATHAKDFGKELLLTLPKTIYVGLSLVMAIGGAISWGMGSALDKLDKDNKHAERLVESGRHYTLVGALQTIRVIQIPVDLIKKLVGVFAAFGNANKEWNAFSHEKGVLKSAHVKPIIVKYNFDAFTIQQYAEKLAPFWELGQAKKKA